MKNQKIRQPIVTVSGHVDHGKTSILDNLRGSCIQEGECGGITQKISFTSFPLDKLKISCPLIEKSGIKLDIPGFLFIDTPGHAAFTNLRKRGGSLADLAILVIDINEGIKPQTAEVIKIMKMNSTPFIIALNKIDNISGWRSPKPEENKDIKSIIESQKPEIQQIFQERYMTFIATLNNHGFDADLYYNISDFSKKIALVPTSAKTQEGLQELVMMLCGLSQKYLKDNLELGKDPKGVMLEIKKEKSTAYNEAILHDGELSKTDQIAIANLDPEKDPTITKIRILEEIKPLSTKFQTKEKVQASTGIRMQLTEKEGILPGMPFEAYKDNKEEIKERFRKQISQAIQTDKQGIIAKADSLGSLEALLTLLKQNNIPVVKAGIGSINKTDIISAKANFEINETDAIVAGFNVDLDTEARALAKENNIKTITDDVIYKLIENLQDWREEKRKEIEKKRLMGLAPLCKITILHDYVFRNTKPAIFGVKVEGGKLKQGLNMISQKGEKIGKIKNIQSENKSVSEVDSGKEVAISIPNINFERQMKDVKTMYTNIGESQFRNLKKNKDLLSSEETKILQEIAEIKRKENPEWGY
ncbi:MAG TPA: translation initiation factor IF-2 [Candidatus Nanoarchaeia archaeon]|nr:translation initiation factor IF-2 [Candidatus Nanoarchaeia archaeon]